MALDKQGKEKIALLVGFILILAVAVLTFQRAQNNEMPPEENTDATDGAKIDYLVISAADLQRKLLAQETLRILDLRSQNEFVNEHIPHSISIPINDLTTSKINSNDDELLVLVGGGTTNYSAAIKILANAGYAKTAVLNGGFAAWKSGGNQIISKGDPASFTDQAKITYTTPEKLKGLLDAGETIFVLDTRSSKDFAEGHLPGAKNIPLQELEQREKELPLSIEIVIYGDSDLQSFQAGVIVYDLNFFTAYVLQGNIQAWKEKGFEIVK